MGRPPTAPVLLTQVRRLATPSSAVAPEFRGWLCVQGEDAVTVVLGGELDRASVRAVRLVLEQALAIRAPRLTIDLRRVAFLDLAGARLVLRCASDATAAGRDVVITRPPRLLPLMASTLGVPVRIVRPPAPARATGASDQISST